MPRGVEARRAFLPGVLALLLVAAGAPGAGAQDLATLSQTRQIGTEDLLRASVRYGAGDLRIGPAEPGTLYRLDLRYDEEILEPQVSYEGGALSVGVGRMDDARGIRGEQSGRLDLELPRDVPTDLRLEFGAVRADLDLGGIRLRGLELATGASDSRVRVAERNTERVPEARFTVGAARFEALDLANLNADRVEVEAGVGDLTLDFGGEWDPGRTMDLEAEMGLGSLEIRVPSHVGIRLSQGTFLVTLDAPGLEERGGARVSDNWEDAEHRLEISVSGALGRLRVVRTD